MEDSTLTSCTKTLLLLLFYMVCVGNYKESLSIVPV